MNYISLFKWEVIWSDRLSAFQFEILICKSVIFWKINCLPIKLVELMMPVYQLNRRWTSLPPWMTYFWKIFAEPGNNVNCVIFCGDSEGFSQRSVRDSSWWRWDNDGAVQRKIFWWSCFSRAKIAFLFNDSNHSNSTRNRWFVEEAWWYKPLASLWQFRIQWSR